MYCIRDLADFAHFFFDSGFSTFLVAPGRFWGWFIFHHFVSQSLGLLGVVLLGGTGIFGGPVVYIENICPSYLGLCIPLSRDLLPSAITLNSAAVGRPGTWNGKEEEGTGWGQINGSDLMGSRR